MIELVTEIPLFQVLGTVLEAIATETPRENLNIWYTKPAQIAAELLLFTAVCIVGTLWTLREPKPKMITQAGDQKLPLILTIYRAILLICFLTTFVHKIVGRKIALMLMPCHVATALYLYCLFTKNTSRAEYVFNIAIHFQFYTWLALLAPDTKALNLFLEVPNFWAHHVILFLIPMHILLTGYYHLDHTRAYYFRLALFIGCWFHFNVQLFASIISGFNVGYILQPPPKTPFTGVWFRWWHAALLALMGWFSGFLIPWVLQEFKVLSHFQKTVDKQNKEHKKSK